MQGRLVAEADVLAVGVTVVATLVVVALLASVAYLLRNVRELRRQAEALARESRAVLDDLDEAVDRAAEEVRRVERMVGSAEAISEAVGTASRAVGGAIDKLSIPLMHRSCGHNVRPRISHKSRRPFSAATVRSGGPFTPASARRPIDWNNTCIPSCAWRPRPPPNKSRRPWRRPLPRGRLTPGPSPTRCIVRPCPRVHR